jgi:hypothetical protein
MKMKRSLLQLVLLLWSNPLNTEAFLKNNVALRHPRQAAAVTGRLYAFQKKDSLSSNNPDEHNINSHSHAQDRERDRDVRRRKRNKANKHATPQRRVWLMQVTEQLLSSPPGSLTNGKWHELTSILTAWSAFTKKDPQAPVHMEALLKRLWEEHHLSVATGNNKEATSMMPTVELYNTVLDAWACAALFKTNQLSDYCQASQRAREILVLLQETYEETKQTALQPNEASFDVVLHVVCRTEGAIIARRLLAWQEYLYKSGKNEYAKPTRNDYLLVLDAYANSRDDNAGQLAEGFIRHMWHSATVEPDTFFYNIVLKTWFTAKRGRESAEHCHRILDEMPDQVPKDLITYASVISAWATSGMRAHGVSRAEELLREIEDHSELEPNTVVLNAVMSAWVKSKNPAAVDRTDEILRQMEASSLSSTRTPPDLISYNTHMHALSMHVAKLPGGLAQRADALLVQMEERYDTGLVSFAPNVFSYNLVIDAWLRSSEPNAAMRAAEVLRKLVKRDNVDPDTFSFNQVLSALSRSSVKGATLMAEELLVYMENAYQSGVHVNAKPDIGSYTSVIVAHSRGGQEGAAERAQQLLDQVKARYASGSGAENSSLKPNRVCYNALIDCWAKSGEGTLGARKAEALLQEMQTMYKAGDASMAPNIVTYNALLNAWARSGTRCCGVKAEYYLDRMWELYKAGDTKVKPNDQSYNTVSGNWMECAVAWDAWLYLYVVSHTFVTHKTPFLFFFNIHVQVINAISKSQNEGKAQKALRMLRRMDKLYQAGNKEARPNEITYTAVLNSCAFPAVLDRRTRRKALDTAIFTLEELQSSPRYGQPNQVTYGTFMKACANLLQDDDAMRREVIERAFQQCCKDGQVGEMVLAYLRQAAPADLYRELLADFIRFGATISVEDLPKEWRCNVKSTERWRDRPNSRKPRMSEERNRPPRQRPIT